MSKTYSNSDTKTRWTQVLMKGKQFFYLKRQRTGYSVKSTTFFNVIEERKNYQQPQNILAQSEFMDVP
jgi:hypothetical protein